MFVVCFCSAADSLFRSLSNSFVYLSLYIVYVNPHIGKHILHAFKCRLFRTHFDECTVGDGVLDISILGLRLPAGRQGCRPPRIEQPCIHCRALTVPPRRYSHGNALSEIIMSISSFVQRVNVFTSPNFDESHKKIFFLACESMTFRRAVSSSDTSLTVPVSDMA